jgi:hypothetical protein
MNSDIIIKLTIALCVGFLAGVGGCAVILLYVSSKYKQDEIFGIVRATITLVRKYQP